MKIATTEWRRYCRDTTLLVAPVDVGGTSTMKPATTEWRRDCRATTLLVAPADDGYRLPLGDQHDEDRHH